MENQIEMLGGLRRRWYFGVTARKVILPEVICSYSSQGFFITKVKKDSPADRANLQVSDVIIALDGITVEQIKNLQQCLDLFSKPAIEVVLWRQNHIEKLAVNLTTKKLEADTSIQIQYDSFCIKKVRVRTIITRPKNFQNNSNYPCILFMQGISCESIDYGSVKDHPYKNILYDFTKHGFMTVRIERFGTGDSEGKLCKDMGFTDEVSLFQAAIPYVMGLDNVDQENLIFFGYSIGGVTAPLVAATVTQKIKALIVFGTLTSRFSEYCIKNMIRQYQLNHMSIEEIAKQVELRRQCYDLLLKKKYTPLEIIRVDEKFENQFVENKYMYGRTYEFFQQLEEVDILSAWEKVTSAVCVIAGMKDIAIEFEENQRLYESMKEHYEKNGNQNKVTFFAPNVDHSFAFYDEEEGKTVFDWKLMEQIREFLAPIVGKKK